MSVRDQEPPKHELSVCKCFREFCYECESNVNKTRKCDLCENIRYLNHPICIAEDTIKIGRKKYLICEWCQDGQDDDDFQYGESENDKLKRLKKRIKEKKEAKKGVDTTWFV